MIRSLKSSAYRFFSEDLLTLAMQKRYCDKNVMFAVFLYVVSFMF